MTIILAPNFSAASKSSSDRDHFFPADRHALVATALRALISAGKTQGSTDRLVQKNWQRDELCVGPKADSCLLARRFTGVDMFGNRILRSALCLILLVAALALPGCEKEKITVGVDVHGVNYRGDEFSYLLINPNNPNDSNAGEHIDPFSTGGTTCCYPLPKQWRPGIKVKIRITHWLPKDKDGHLPEVKEEQTAEVSPYLDGKPGELWVLRGEDGIVSVVSSDYQPDHPKWPGKVKSWPIPSLEYRRARWELYRQHEEGGVRLYLSLLDQLEKDPAKRAREDWDFALERDTERIKGFSGPDDPRFRASLKNEYEDGLERSEALLKEVMEAKP